MTCHPDTLEHLRKLGKECHLAGFEGSDDDILVEKLFTHHLFDVFKIKVLSQDLLYQAKIKNSTVPSSVVEAYLTRENTAASYFNKITENLLPKIVAYDARCLTAIEEGLTGYETLWHKVVDLSRVDHGFTCDIARQLAKLHRETHSRLTSAAKQAEIQQLFGSSQAAEYLEEHVFGRTLQVNDPELDPDIKHLAENIQRQAQFRDAVNSVREMYTGDRKCVIHGNFNMTSIAVNEDRSMKFTDFGYAHLGPCMYDLGALVAHYLIAYYVHILTEEDNASHRQVAYCMQDAVRKTIETYLEETSSLDDEQQRTRSVKEVAAFTGIHLFAKSLDVIDCRCLGLTKHVQKSILQSGHRLLNKYNAIDNTGRLLLIALQLC